MSIIASQSEGQLNKTPRQPVLFIDIIQNELKLSQKSGKLYGCPILGILTKSMRQLKLVQQYDGYSPKCWSLSGKYRN